MFIQFKNVDRFTEETTSRTEVGVAVKQASKREDSEPQQHQEQVQDSTLTKRPWVARVVS